MTQQTPTLETALPQHPMPEPSVGPRWLPVRTLHDGHRKVVLEHLLALNRQDRALRFAHAASDEQLHLYASQIDFVHDEVFGVFDRRLRLVAMAHLAFDHDGLTAEFGVSVLERVRGRGFGARLFDHAVMHARNRGVSTLVLYVARENAAMLGIVRRAGASLSFEGTEATARLPLVANTLGSQVEALIEARAAEFDYQLKMHVLRLDRLWPMRAARTVQHMLDD